MGAGLLYGAVSAVTAAVNGFVYYDIGVTTTESVYTSSEVSSQRSTIGEREQVLRIWTENNGLITSDVFYAELIDKQVNMYVEIIEKEFPLSLEASDAIRNILKIQLEGYYGLRK